MRTTVKHVCGKKNMAEDVFRTLKNDSLGILDHLSVLEERRQEHMHPDRIDVKTQHDMEHTNKLTDT